MLVSLVCYTVKYCDIIGFVCLFVCFLFLCSFWCVCVVLFVCLFVLIFYNYCTAYNGFVIYFKLLVFNLKEISVKLNMIVKKSN